MLSRNAKLLVSLLIAVATATLYSPVCQAQQDLTWTGKTGVNDDPDWTTLVANKNWQSGGNPKSYADGDLVTFDDTATGPRHIRIQAAGVQPGKITVNTNAAVQDDYDLSGGKIKGNTRLYKDGTGRLTLAGGNTYTGTNFIYRGRVGVTGDDALGTGELNLSSGVMIRMDAAAVTLSNRSVVVYGELFTEAIGDLKFTGDVILANNHTVEVLSGDSSLTYAGKIDDRAQTYSLTVSSAGTVVLTGANTYKGGTTVRQGKLRVSNAAGSGTGTGNVVVDGGELAGKGKISGKVTVKSGSDIRPGDSPGTLTVGEIQLDPGAIFGVQLNGIVAGVSYSQLWVTGPVSLDGSILDAQLGYDPVPGDTLIILRNEPGVPIIGTFVGLQEGSVLHLTNPSTGGSFDFRISYLGGAGNDVTLTASPQPTPSPTSTPLNVLTPRPD